MFNFAPEIIDDKSLLGPWKILIVDDDADVHNVTKLVLKNFTFDDRPVEFLDANSGAEAVKVIEENPDIALAIVDVVMESNMAGLELINHIRNDMCNHMIRLVLRTGQPGDAPQEVVIRDYEIDDYKSKTELSAQKLRTLMYASLRAYRDLQILNDNRKGLVSIIDGLANLLDSESIKTFAQATLIQLVSLLRLGKHAVFVEYTAPDDKPHYLVYSATGALSRVMEEKDCELPNTITNVFQKAIKQQDSVYDEMHIVGFFKSHSGREFLLYIHDGHSLTMQDKRLIQLYCENVAVALERINT